MPRECTCPLCGAPVKELPLTLLPERGMVVAGGAFVHLSGTEAMLLQRLADVYPRHMSKEAILDWLYQLNPDDAPEIKIVDVFICKIRKKIERLGIRIDTLWGKGYALATPMRIAKEAA